MSSKRLKARYFRCANCKFQVLLASRRQEFTLKSLDKIKMFQLRRAQERDHCLMIKFWRSESGNLTIR